MNRTLLLGVAGALSMAAHADYRVEMNAIDIRGVGSPLGDITVAERGSGVVLEPNLKGLPAGPHGFHLHEFANCAARAKDGRMSAGEQAGGHWDPDKRGHHGAPGKGGHKGDLPPLAVAADGTAREPIEVSHLKLRDFAGKSLVVHAGGDNFSDQPKPNGGGGDRIACGVVQPGQKPAR